MTKRVHKTSESDNLIVILTHLGGIFLSFLPSLVVYLVADGKVKNQARLALNWQLSLLVYGFLSTLLIMILIGLFFMWAMMVLNVIFSIIAAVKSSKDATFVYPLSIQFIK
jgi:uncharacterized Tic20 family protein